MSVPAVSSATSKNADAKKTSKTPLLLDSKKSDQKKKKTERKARKRVRSPKTPKMQSFSIRSKREKKERKCECADEKEAAAPPFVFPLLQLTEISFTTKGGLLYPFLDLSDLLACMGTCKRMQKLCISEATNRCKRMADLLNLLHWGDYPDTDYLVYGTHLHEVPMLFCSRFAILITSPTRKITKLIGLFTSDYPAEFEEKELPFFGCIRMPGCHEPEWYLQPGLMNAFFHDRKSRGLCNSQTVQHMLALAITRDDDIRYLYFPCADWDTKLPEEVPATQDPPPLESPQMAHDSKVRLILQKARSFTLKSEKPMQSAGYKHVPFASSRLSAGHEYLRQLPRPFGPKKIGDFDSQTTEPESPPTPVFDSRSPARTPLYGQSGFITGPESPDSQRTVPYDKDIREVYCVSVTNYPCTTGFPMQSHSVSLGKMVLNLERYTCRATERYYDGCHIPHLLNIMDSERLVYGKHQKGDPTSELLSVLAGLGRRGFEKAKPIITPPGYYHDRIDRRLQQILHPVRAQLALEHELVEDMEGSIAKQVQNPINLGWNYNYVFMTRRSVLSSRK